MARHPSGIAIPDTKMCRAHDPGTPKTAGIHWDPTQKRHDPGRSQEIPGLFLERRRDGGGARVVSGALDKERRKRRSIRQQPVTEFLWWWLPKRPRCPDPALGLVVMARLNQRRVGCGLLLSDSTTRNDQRPRASASPRNHLIKYRGNSGVWEVPAFDVHGLTPTC